MQRRNFLKAGAVGLMSAAYHPAAKTSNKDPSDNTFLLTAANGQVNLVPDQQQLTRVMHYNGSVPGPVLRVPQGQKTSIVLKNALDEPTTLHWHGLRIDNAMDGVPGMTQSPVQPGEEFTYRFSPPDAGTYWYHTHNRTWSQLTQGLSGVLIVEEEQPAYVDQDLVFAVDDWRLSRTGELDTDSLGNMHDKSHGGRIGNFLTVNGKLDPAFDVAGGERLRLRFINIANARVMRLLIPEPGIQIVAMDGQPVLPREPENGVFTLAPSQRVDVIVDVTSGPGKNIPIELLIGEHAYQIAHLRIGQMPKRQHPLESPIDLPLNPQNRIKLSESVMQVPVHMQGGAHGNLQFALMRGEKRSIRELVKEGKAWALNGVTDLPADPLFRVRRGTTISLDVHNDTGWPHAMHIHGHHFIHDRYPGIWRDTTLFEAQEKGSMIFLADNPGKWLFHCHIVEHMAGGMGTWFEVI